MVHIIAYTYEADYHCIACTKKRFMPAIDNKDYNPNTTDANHIPYNATDKEGNEINPVFTTDEISLPLACGTCLETIKE